MCGIVFVHRNDGKPAQKMTMKRYHFQSSRGKSGFGYISIDKDNKFVNWGRALDEKGIKEVIENEDSPTIMFHHRQPTSTPNLLEATHPIKVSNEMLDDDYYVIHNGVISNDWELKEIHEKVGFNYTTEIKEHLITKEKTYEEIMFNDSESFAIELAQVLDGEKFTIDAEGSIAFVALQVDKEKGKIKNVFFGRNNSNPLKVSLKDDFLTITSEGDGVLVKANNLYRYDMELKTINIRSLEIGESLWKYDKYARDEEKDYSGYVSRDPSSRTMGFKTVETNKTTERELTLPLLETIDYDTESSIESYQMTEKDEEDDFNYTSEDVLEDLLLREEDLLSELRMAASEEHLNEVYEKLEQCRALIVKTEEAIAMEIAEKESQTT